VHGAIFDGVIDEETERRLAAHMTDFFWRWATFVRLDQSFIADGRCFVAKVFLLRTNDIRYDADGAPYIIS
jgi:hypothetical protein